MSLTLGQSQWEARGSGVLGPLIDPARPAHLFEGAYDTVTVDGAGGGNGLFSGFFSSEGDTSDPTFPGGAGLTYHHCRILVARPPSRAPLHSATLKDAAGSPCSTHGAKAQVRLSLHCGAR
ncbi:MAG: hypothetical protein U5K38_15810 [Woeseiaceae bacterium]|nr:hypothetical protein [Woeseiaceae bacterium]